MKKRIGATPEEYKPLAEKVLKVIFDELPKDPTPKDFSVAYGALVACQYGIRSAMAKIGCSFESIDMGEEVQ